MSTAVAKELDLRTRTGGVVTGSPSTADSSSQGSSEDLAGKASEKKVRSHATEVYPSIPPLGAPAAEKRFWFQRNKTYDPNAIATQHSVFDDPETLKEYQPPDSWENIHRFNPLARWTWGEEHKLIRKIDLKIMIWACVMFMALELDRANINQALTDNFLKDLHMTTNDYNLGNTVFKLSFLCAELPSQLVSKWMGPDRWIPTQMVLWSIVASCQFWLAGRESFLVCRSLLGILQGGFIPDIILYLSYFYKHHELSLRLGFFWTAMSIADVIAAFMAYGLLHLRGLHNYSGWRWMFLIEGVLTLLLGLASFVLMPPSPTQTASKLRGKKGWFTEREEIIMVNRVIREDPTKSGMHNREPITPKLLWKSMCDYDLWPLYIIGLMFQIPETTPAQYLTLTLKGLGFGTFNSNLLVIPSTVMHMITMLLLTYVAEIWGELTLTASFGQFYVLPFLIFIYVKDITKINKWTAFGVMTGLLSYPSAHPIQVAWNSRNSYAVRSRTVSAALYNMFVQASGIIASNIYRADDAPRYKRGNRVLLSICITNIALYSLTKVYYVSRNRSRAKKWDAMTEDERVTYLATTTDEGNKRLDFRFAH
ncbi:MFS general substrate transporter [Glarea lozoyensis ATCC 20868]|uniref:MFS general substrate transporter n=1 Tax=Glarea lozoyensis (strain ATCC 20868 / MF5171) TaxID=1116229 RepID=S3DGA5_GLAL2|nr:MFS general substrate transporter [Glarea lozoyensis ATCC 20868]EPE36730.1 MFS general substrate transporter [Glarea lozoyensis ATCC 20868]